MTSATRNLLDLLKGLPERERAAITHELLLSLEEEDFDSDSETAWAAEIERRLAAVEKGQFSAQPWREAIEAIRQSLSQGPSS
jgi:putative addiction module component (TIGR02574 family)